MFEYIPKRMIVSERIGEFEKQIVEGRAKSTASALRYAEISNDEAISIHVADPGLFGQFWRLSIDQARGNVMGNLAVGLPAVTSLTLWLPALIVIGASPEGTFSSKEIVWIFAMLGIPGAVVFLHELFRKSLTISDAFNLFRSDCREAFTQALVVGDSGLYLADGGECGVIDYWNVSKVSLEEELGVVRVKVTERSHGGTERLPVIGRGTVAEAEAVAAFIRRKAEDSQLVTEVGRRPRPGLLHVLEERERLAA